MKKRIGTAAAALLLLTLTGCIGATSTLDVYAADNPPTENGRRSIGAAKASNRGLYLFYYLPVWSGKPQTPNLYRYKAFQDYLRKGYMNLMLDAGRAELGGKEIENVRYLSSSNGWWGLGIFWLRSMHAEATIIGDPPAAEKKKK